eukprot:652143-Pyramimonas_sp.AAC.2
MSYRESLWTTLAYTAEYMAIYDAGTAKIRTHQNAVTYVIAHVFGGQRLVGKSMCGIKGYGKRCALGCWHHGVCVWQTHLLELHGGDVLEVVVAAQLKELDDEVHHGAVLVEASGGGLDVQRQPALGHAQGLVVALP